MKHGYCLQRRHSSYLCEGRDIIGAGPDNYHLCHQRLCLFVATTKLSVATLFCVRTQRRHGIATFICQAFFMPFLPIFSRFLCLFFQLCLQIPVIPGLSPLTQQSGIAVPRRLIVSDSPPSWQLFAMFIKWNKTCGDQTRCFAKQRCRSHDGEVKVTTVFAPFCPLL